MSGERGEDSLAEDERGFLYEVGRAITEWAHAEEELFFINHAITKTAQRYVAVIYYRTPTLYGRIDLTTDLIDAAAPESAKRAGAHTEPTVAIWKKLAKDLKGNLKVRNRLAHSPASPQVQLKEGDAFAISDIWYASYTSRTERLRGKNAKQDLRISDVQAHTKEVGRLINRLRNFRHNELPKLLG